MKYFAMGLLAVFITLGLDALFPAPPAQADRGESCACEELRAIRRILESQFNVVCDSRRCLPAPTPTVPNGGELP